MTAWDGRWPDDAEAYDRLVQRAKVRYEPLVNSLPPWELGALIEVIGPRMDEIRRLANVEDAKRAAR